MLPEIGGRFGYADKHFDFIVFFWQKPETKGNSNYSVLVRDKAALMNRSVFFLVPRNCDTKQRSQQYLGKAHHQGPGWK